MSLSQKAVIEKRKFLKYTLHLYPVFLFQGDSYILQRDMREKYALRSIAQRENIFPVGKRVEKVPVNVERDSLIHALHSYCGPGTRPSSVYGLNCVCSLIDGPGDFPGVEQTLRLILCPQLICDMSVFSPSQLIRTQYKGQ
jgi:hypothetical protein